jgi:hypothetical protein
LCSRRPAGRRGLKLFYLPRRESRLSIYYMLWSTDPSL